MNLQGQDLARATPQPLASVDLICPPASEIDLPRARGGELDHSAHDPDGHVVTRDADGARPARENSGLRLGDLPFMAFSAGLKALLAFDPHEARAVTPDLNLA